MACQPACCISGGQRFGLKTFDDVGACAGRGERDVDGAPVIDFVGKICVRFDGGVRAGEIERNAAVLRRHGELETAADAQVVLRSGGVPVVRGVIPLHDVFG